MHLNLISHLAGDGQKGVQSQKESLSNETYVLTLSGKCLDVSHLVNKKKFRSRGGRDGALNAMKHLEEDKLGKLAVKTEKGSIKVCSEMIVYHPDMAPIYTQT